LKKKEKRGLRDPRQFSGEWEKRVCCWKSGSCYAKPKMALDRNLAGKKKQDLTRQRRLSLEASSSASVCGCRKLLALFGGV
jgi:hypothetical protein